MHELSIALSLIEIASEAAERAGAARVTRVQLQVGALAGVVRSALEFSFGVAAEGTLIAGAALQIEELPARVRCAECGATEDLPDIQRFRCPRCGAPTSNLVQGRELDLIAIEYEAAPAAAAP